MDNLNLTKKEKNLDPANLENQGGCALFCAIVLLVILVKEPITALFLESGEPMFMTFGKVMRIMLIVFFIMAMSTFAKYAIAFVIVYKKAEYSTFGIKYLRFFHHMEAVSGSLDQIFFGIMFGGFGVFIAFVEGIEKPLHWEYIGKFFALLGIMIIIKGIYSLIRGIIKEAGSR